MASRFALVLVLAPVLAIGAGCGGLAPPQPANPDDFRHPDVDPIACPEVALARLGARLPAAQLTIGQQAIVEAQRIDRLPCARGMKDEACLEAARRRGVPAGYELVALTIGGDSSLVEMTYDVDGVRTTEQAEAFDVIVAKLKALQGQGRKVTVIEGHTVPGAESRHARLVYAREGGRQRRFATLRWRPDGEPAMASAEAQRAAEAERMFVQKLEREGEELVMTATCADPGGGDVSPGI
ncbi:MAG: hypothetical protein M3680_14325 [Myxococcota bacterium]|nr:hypothetical protein [Myxococcota bacterium]